MPLKGNQGAQRWKIIQARASGEVRWNSTLGQTSPSLTSPRKNNISSYSEVIWNLKILQKPKKSCRQISRRCHHQVSPPCLLAGTQLMSAISFDILVIRPGGWTAENVADCKIAFFNTVSQAGSKNIQYVVCLCLTFHLLHISVLAQVQWEWVSDKQMPNEKVERLHTIGHQREKREYRGSHTPSPRWDYGRPKMDSI